MHHNDDEDENEEQDDIDVERKDQDPNSIERKEGQEFLTNYAKGDVGESLAFHKLDETKLVPVRTGIDERHYDEVVIGQHGVTDYRVYAKRTDDADDQVDRLRTLWDCLMLLLGDRAKNTLDEGGEDVIDYLNKQIDDLEREYFEPVGNLEVKTKTKPKGKRSWYRRINVSCHRQYLDVAQNEDIPTGVWFFECERIKDENGKSAAGDLIRHGIVPIDPDQSADTYDDIRASDQILKILGSDDHQEDENDVVEYKYDEVEAFGAFLYRMVESSETLDW